jgi:Abortive infection alpha
MSDQTPEGDPEFASAPTAGDVSLESPAELGASVILMRNVARELGSAIEHAQGALTSSWNALNYLGNSESAAGDVASSATEGPGMPRAPGSTTTSAGILGTNPLTDMLGKVIDAAAKPVGEGLRQAQRIATAPITGINDIVEKVAGTGARDETDALRKRGNALIRISYQPELQRRDVHPSFSHILDELLPDEARILRFLGVAGAQPMIDVRTKTLLQIGSVLLVGGVSVVASMAGCHWPDRDQHYFANLSRLGLVDLSSEPVDDYRRYALLEVQPVALHAIENVPKAITIYRSITLTAFGRQFIEVCINTEGYNAGGWDTDGRQDKIRGKRSQDHGSQNRKQA